MPMQAHRLNKSVEVVARSECLGRRIVRRKKTPQEKKALAYKKDHVIATQARYGFARAWARKKARANQKERSQVRQMLARLRPLQTDEQREDFPLRPVRRDRVRKWKGSAVPLGQWIGNRQRVRAYRVAWNFFKSPYESQSHQERFAAFLQTLVLDSQSTQARETARHFAHLLAPGSSAIRDDSWNTEQKRAWLRAFLQDTPDWEKRLWDWIYRCEERVRHS